MTLTRPYAANFYVGNGVRKTFSFTFDEVSENFVKVIISHENGTTTVPTYTVDLNSSQITLGEGTEAPTSSDIICIYRETPTIQDTPFRTLQGYNAKALENILSKIVAMIQEIKSTYFSTNVLQGTPWELDLLKDEDDGATVQIDYVARKLVKGLYFQISNGNLQVSADGITYITMPKSSDIMELRQTQVQIPNVGLKHKLQYRVGNNWYDASEDIAGSAVTINDFDNATIRKDNRKFTAFGTKNHNAVNNAIKTVYDWIGTEAEYYEQDIGGQYPDWVCFITDDDKKTDSIYITVDYNSPNERLVITSGSTGVGTKITQANYSSTYTRLVLS